MVRCVRVGGSLAAPHLASCWRQSAVASPDGVPRCPAGEGILSNLDENRNTLTRIRGNVGVVSGSLDEARRILRSMGRREVRTKLAIGIFALVMIAIIIGLVVWVSKKGDAPQ